MRWTFGLSSKAIWAPTTRAGCRSSSSVIAGVERMTVDLEAGVEEIRRTGARETEATTRRFYLLGYRWDFQPEAWRDRRGRGKTQAA